MSSRLKVEIYRPSNGEWSFRVIRGARVVLVPGESYKLRGAVRRAVLNLAGICTDRSSSSWVSPLQAACMAALVAEQRAWDARPRR